MKRKEMTHTQRNKNGRILLGQLTGISYELCLPRGQIHSNYREVALKIDNKEVFIRDIEADEDDIIYINLSFKKE